MCSMQLFIHKMEHSEESYGESKLGSEVHYGVWSIWDSHTILIGCDMSCDILIMKHCALIFSTNIFWYPPKPNLS